VSILQAGPVPIPMLLRQPLRKIPRPLTKAIPTQSLDQFAITTCDCPVAEGSGASIHLNEQAGFTHVGLLKEVGFKFGKRLGVHIMQKMLN
ncbi:MAG: hypothetical protein Q8K78_04065, partial [Planctomycetaceae bacterium]|nr:hypothetical protein [Planctomycetaceae bacterium]